MQANLQIGVINFQCNTNLKQKFSEIKLQDFASYLPKEISCAQMLWFKNDVAFGCTSVCVCMRTQFFPLMSNTKTKIQFHLRDGHMNLS